MDRLPKQRSWRYSISTGLVASLITGFFSTSASAQTDHVWKPMPLTTPSQLSAGELGGEGCQRPQMIEMDQEDGKLILYGTDVGGLFRSTDAGKSFKAANQGLETTGVVGIKVDPKNKDRVLLIGDGGGNQYNVYGGVYLSTDQGATWSRKKSRWLDAVGSGRQNGRDQIAFDISSYDSGLDRCQTVYWVSEDDKQDSKGALWKSTNGGSSWSIVCQDTQYGGADDAYSLIEVHPTLGYVYIANKNGFYRSTDGGATFTQIMSGNFKSLDVVSSAPNTVWAAKGSTLYKSTDSGATLNTVTTSGISNIYHLKVSPVNNNHMVAGDSGNSNKPYYSTDGGATWAASGVDMSAGWIPSSAMSNNRFCSRVWHPTDADLIWSTGKGDQATKSTDKGANFAYAGNGIHGVMIGHGFSFNYHNLDLVYLGFQDYNGGMTTDRGKSWSHVNLPTGDSWGWVRSAYAISDQKYFGIDENYGTGNFDLWYTANGGTNKTKKVSNIGGLRICYGDPTDADVVFAGNRRSSDAGASWSTMTGCKGVFIHDFSNGDLYGANDKDVVRSTDKGATWTVVATLTKNVTDIAYDHVNDRLWVTAGDKLYQCDGPAYSPSQKSVGGCPASTVAIDPNNTDIIYCGGTNGTWRRQDNHVMRSTNGGANWHKLVNQNGAYGPDGGSCAEWIRVHPSTGDAWVATNCYGMWRFGTPENLAPSADAYVRGGTYGNDNYGTSTSLVVKKTSGSTLRYSFLNFDLSVLDGDSVKSAKLVMNLAAPAGSATLTLKAVSSDTWTETGITYNNRPSVGSQIASKSLTTSTTKATFDITDYIKQEYLGDKSASMRFESNNSVYLNLRSREHISPPVLVVEMDDISSAAEATTTFAPVEDSYVRAGTYASNNYGSETFLRVKDSADAQYDRQSLIKFNLNNVAGIVSAKLRVKTVARQDSTSVPIRLYEVTDDTWAESTVTWNNKPAAGTFIQSITANSIGQTLEYDVTSFITAQAGGDGVASFLLKDTAVKNRNYDFGSRESADAPELVIVHTGSVELEPSDDAFVRYGTYANTNYGSTVDIQMKENSNNDFDRKSLIKFDLSAMGGTVSNATLSFVVTSTTAATIKIAKVDDDNWDEATVTANNRPPSNGEITSVSLGASTTEALFDVTDYVNAQIDGDGTVSLLVFMSEQLSPVIKFESKEGANTPLLILTP